MDQVPDSAACNEAVKLAKKRGFSRLSGFVNGVLRNISRKRNDQLSKEGQESCNIFVCDLFNSRMDHKILYENIRR